VLIHIGENNVLYTSRTSPHTESTQHMVSVRRSCFKIEVFFFVSDFQFFASSFFVSGSSLCLPLAKSSYFVELLVLEAKEGPQVRFVHFDLLHLGSP